MPSTSYRTIDRLSRKTEMRRIVISEVNPTTSTVSGKDQIGNVVQINFDFHAPLLVVPQVGELWVASRYDQDWRLGYRAERDMQTTANSLVPGDQRVEASNDLYLNAKGLVSINAADVLINGQPLSAFLLTQVPNNLLSEDIQITYVPDGDIGAGNVQTLSKTFVYKDGTTQSILETFIYDSQGNVIQRTQTYS